MKFKNLIAAAAIATIGLGATASAQDAPPRSIKHTKDWTAYIANENGNRVCFMISMPKSSYGKYTNRGETYAIVTHRPAEKSRDVVSIVAGYTYQDNNNVKIEINGDTFRLYPHEDTAWARSAETDSELTEAIRKGSTMIVNGYSSRGTYTKDTYSLAGSSDAYDAITEACGLS